MADDIFRFRSVWRVSAPLEIIWNTVGKVTEYPTWWPGISRVDLLAGQELPIMTGTKASYEVHSPLYTLRYQTEVVEFDTGVYILALSQGDLRGTGRWSFEEKEGETQATFDWEVALHPPFLKAVSHLPGAKGVMRFFHNKLMSDGEKGLKQLVEKELNGLHRPNIAVDA
jgi:hypothetical protein